MVVAAPSLGRVQILSQERQPAAIITTPAGEPVRLRP
jgi:hypothetical protein